MVNDNDTRKIAVFLAFTAVGHANILTAFHLIVTIRVILEEIVCAEMTRKSIMCGSISISHNLVIRANIIDVNDKKTNS